MKFLLIIFFIFLFSVPVRAEDSLKLNDLYATAQQRLQENPEDPERQCDLAAVYAAGLEFDRSLALYEEVLKKHPRHKRALIELCALHTESHHEEKAVKFCDLLIENFPTEALVWDQRGLMKFKFGYFQESLVDFMESIRRSPDSLAAPTHALQAFIAMEQNKAALHFAKKILDEFKNAKPQERAMLHYSAFLAATRLKFFPIAFEHIRETYALSENPLFLGKVVVAWIRNHQIFFFFLVSTILIVSARYFGQRLNQFLKNEKP